MNTVKQLENINIKLLSENAKVPTRGSEYAAGYDLYANTTDIIDIAPHSTVKVGTGISMELPENTFGAIFARSGLATKKGLRPANCVGVCDSDYRGEYVVALHNDTDEIMSIEPNERIAQLIVMPFIPVNFTVVEELNETERGDGGFGSTGTN
jgi:dUTP pyrophosphatase